MRILVITSSYVDPVSGREAAGSFVSDFVIELNRSAQVAVVAPGRSDEVTSEHGSSLWLYRAPLQPLSLLSPSSPTHWPAILKTLISGYRTTLRAARQFKPSHILALWALPCGLWAASAARNLGLEYSVWCLGSDIWSLGRNPLTRPLVKSVLRGARYRFADGIGLCSDVESIVGRDCRFLPTSRNLVPPPKRRSKSRPYRLTFLGRWHHNKGVDLLLDALDLLTAKDWRSIESIAIYGGGALDQQVRRRVREIQELGHPVCAHGYLGKDEATVAIADADFLLLPSRIESIPVVFSDAMQCATPIIASPAGDLPRLIAEYSPGVVAADISPASFASAISQALQSGPRLYSEGLSEASEAFAIGRVCTHFIDLINHKMSNERLKKR